jgi:ubiquinol-cytochrome c reductase cytochrome c1 subunit
MKRTNRLMARARAGLLTLAFSLMLAPLSAWAEHAELDYFRVDTANKAGLQRGARDFMAYCSGCHSLKYLRYNRLAKDLDIPEDLLKANLMFTSDKPGDTIRSAMPATASDWFGQMPPDLSLEARARGADWVYTYLNSFYVDPSRPLGVNNTVLPNVSMPHVLAELQGLQVKKDTEHAEAQPEAGKAAEPEPAKAEEPEGHHGPKFELATKGKLSPEEYKQFTADLTNFLVYAAEPARNARMSKGWDVVAFLLLFMFVAYLLKKEYWKDVH